MPEPTIDRVEIVTNDDGTITVWPYWKGVDRPQGAGWGLRDNANGHKLARRLKAALESGKAFTKVSVAYDINGNTFATTQGRLLGRTLNADLKRIGF